LGAGGAAFFWLFRLLQKNLQILQRFAFLYRYSKQKPNFRHIIAKPYKFHGWCTDFLVGFSACFPTGFRRIMKHRHRYVFYFAQKGVSYA